MRSVSAAFATAIALGTVKITELYILDMADGTTYRYTTHDTPITWDSGNNTYTPVPMRRGEVSFTTNFEAGEVSVNLANISLDISNDVNNDILERAELTIKRIRWDASYASDEEFTVFKGFLDVDFNRSVLNLTVKSKFASLSVQIPRFLFEECCNYNLFDSLCALSRSDYEYSGTATDGTQTTLIDSNRGSVYKVAFDAGDSSNPIERDETITGGDNSYTAVVVQIVYLTSSTGYVWYVELSNSNNFNDDETLTSGGDTIDVNGTPAEDTTFYELGEVEMTSGDNNGQKRPVALDSSGTITFLWPFVSAIATSDTYNLYPGCDLRGVTCEEKFHNETVFRGWLYVPRVEDTVM
jgi:hypothetical protein